MTGLVSQLVTKYRRWRLKRAYSTLVARRDGMDGPLSGTLATRFEMQQDGILEIEEGEKHWHWPEDWPLESEQEQES